MKHLSRLLPTLLLATAALTASAVEIDLRDRQQRIDGFGTCLISWGKFPEQTYTPAFARIYAEDMGLNILRCELSGGTLPEKTEPSRMNYRDFELEGYSGSAEVFLDFAKELKKVNPDIKIIGTVWTPPGWMKAQGGGASDKLLSKGKKRSLGNNANTYGQSKNYVSKEHYPHFVAWLIQMAEMFEAQGTPLYAVSPGNEVMFTQWFQSCTWTAPDYAEIVALLGREMEKQGKDILIFGPETMTGHNFAHGNPPYLRELKKGEAAKQLDIWATHGYEDGIQADMSASSPAQFRDLIKDTGKPYWVTEGGTGGHEWPDPLSGVAAAIHNNFVHGNASAFVPWQISGKKPTSHGLMVNDTMTKKSHAVRHFSKFIEEGAYRVKATPTEDDGLAASAYHHPESGEVTVVLINSASDGKTVDLDFKNAPGLDRLTVTRTTEDEDFANADVVSLRNGKGQLDMPARSIVTLSGGSGTRGGDPGTAAMEPLDAPRIWTDLEGRTIEAAPVRIIDSERILIRRSDNREFVLHLRTLSEDDRKYVEELAAR